MRKAKPTHRDHRPRGAYGRGESARGPRPVVAMLLAGGSLALAIGVPVRAAAQTLPACSALQPPPVYLEIGDTQEPLIKNLGRLLASATVAEAKMTLVYRTSGSCTNIADIVRSATVSVQTLSYAPSTTSSAGWAASSASFQCTVDPGTPYDVANSNVFISACPTSTVPASIGVWYGGIQPYVFAVPAGSGQTAVTAEEAYFMFGFGDVAGITPWVNKALRFVRSASKSTLVALAKNIGVPPSLFVSNGTVPNANPGKDSSSDVVNALETSSNAEQTIGLLGAEVYDRNRDKLKVLAFRAFGQDLAYYPDSTSSARDKQNTRDGHYTPWSPTVYMTPVSSGVPTGHSGTGHPAGAPANGAKIAYLLDLISSKAPNPDPGFDPLKSAIIKVGLVPSCAMKVQRTEEGGALKYYAPPEPCGCFFENAVATSSSSANSSCVACSAANPCASGVCRHGFCEAR